MGIMAIIGTALDIADKILGRMEINLRRKYTDQLFEIKSKYRELRQTPYDFIDDVRLKEATDGLGDLLEAINRDMVAPEAEGK